jgi:hypothetical protein
MVHRWRLWKTNEAMASVTQILSCRQSKGQPATRLVVARQEKRAGLHKKLHGNQGTLQHDLGGTSGINNWLAGTGRRRRDVRCADAGHEKQLEGRRSPTQSDSSCSKYGANSPTGLSAFMISLPSAWFYI